MNIFKHFKTPKINKETAEFNKLTKQEILSVQAALAQRAENLLFTEGLSKHDAEIQFAESSRIENILLKIWGIYRERTEHETDNFPEYLMTHPFAE